MTRRSRRLKEKRQKDYEAEFEDADNVGDHTAIKSPVLPKQQVPAKATADITVVRSSPSKGFGSELQTDVPLQDPVIAQSHGSDAESIGILQYTPQRCSYTPHDEISNIAPVTKIMETLNQTMMILGDKIEMSNQRMAEEVSHKLSRLEECLTNPSPRLNINHARQPVSTPQTHPAKLTRENNGFKRVRSGQTKKGQTHRNRNEWRATNCPDESDTDSVRDYSDSDDDESSNSRSIQSQILHKKQYSSTHNVKLPPFNGKDSWKIWFSRFEVIAERNQWSREECLDQLLPRLHGGAADFVFGQLSSDVISNYSKLVSELNNRYRVIENRKTFAAQLHKRNQRPNETVEEFAADLKRLYDKAHVNRDPETRREDLLRRFFDGLSNERASFEVEFHKEPLNIDQAVFHVVNFEEIKHKSHHSDDSSRHKKVRRSRHESDSWSNDTDENDDIDERPGSQTRQVTRRRMKGSHVKEVRFKHSNIKSNSKKDTANDRKVDQKTESPNNNAKESKGNANEVELLRQEIGELKEELKKQHVSFDSTQKPQCKTCFRCGKPGHFARDCPVARHQMFQPNQARQHNFRYNVNAPTFQPAHRGVTQQPTNHVTQRPYTSNSDRRDLSNYDSYQIPVIQSTQDIQTMNTSTDPSLTSDQANHLNYQGSTPLVGRRPTH